MGAGAVHGPDLGGINVLIDACGKVALFYLGLIFTLYLGEGCVSVCVWMLRRQVCWDFSLWESSCELCGAVPQVGCTCGCLISRGWIRARHPRTHWLICGRAQKGPSIVLKRLTEPGGARSPSQLHRDGHGSKVDVWISRRSSHAHASPRPWAFQGWAPEKSLLCLFPVSAVTSWVAWNNTNLLSYSFGGQSLKLVLNGLNFNRAAFTLVGLRENPFLCLFRCLEAAYVPGSWPLPPSWKLAMQHFQISFGFQCHEPFPDSNPPAPFVWGSLWYMEPTHLIQDNFPMSGSLVTSPKSPLPCMLT